VRSMVTEYGMSERLGLLTYERESRSAYLQVPEAGRGKEYSEKTAQEIDEEMGSLLAAAQERVRSVLHGKRPLLERMARVLLDKEVLEGEALQAFAREAREGDTAEGQPRH